jgi:hypothetical protein
MTRGLLAPLSPQEEMALRRIAHGSVVVDAEVAAKLVRLAVVEHVHSSLRLTPLGRLRFNALPKAPLMSRQRSVQVTSDYVAGVIEKAQDMAKRQLPKATTAPSIAEELPPQAEPAIDDDCLPRWKARAASNIAKTREIITEQRKWHERLCEDSRRRIAISRSLLEETAPVTPPWPSALQ